MVAVDYGMLASFMAMGFVVWGTGWFLGAIWKVITNTGADFAGVKHPDF